MNDKTLEVFIASPPDRDCLVVQLFVKDGGQWGEIIKNGDNVTLELYPEPSDGVWRLDMSEVLHVLTLGQKELLDRCSG